MITYFKICWVCVTISGLWFVMSALVAWHITPFGDLQLPIALLMGGSVVGIAYQRHLLRWKIATITVGMPTAFLFITNLNKITVFIELVILLAIAYKLFVYKVNNNGKGRAHELEEKMKNCC
ncbi:MAG: hypothetical protein Q7R89_01440 [bacterium]|nr:hypothetical protein [bacterium]